VLGLEDATLLGLNYLMALPGFQAFLVAAEKDLKIVEKKAEEIVEKAEEIVEKKAEEINVNVEAYKGKKSKSY
jgi:hypothetical protein